MDIMELMREFHSKLDPKGPFTPDRRALREFLLREETEEYCRASYNDDKVNMADALGDVVYVAFGTAYCMGIDLNAVIAEIHRSNMTKESGPTGKAIKGKDYSPPDIIKVLND